MFLINLTHLKNLCLKPICLLSWMNGCKIKWRLIYSRELMNKQKWNLLVNFSLGSGKNFNKYGIMKPTRIEMQESNDKESIARIEKEKKENAVNVKKEREENEKNEKGGREKREKGGKMKQGTGIMGTITTMAGQELIIMLIFNILIKNQLLQFGFHILLKFTLKHKTQMLQSHCHHLIMMDRLGCLIRI